MHDLRYALRLLRKTPGFATAAILTLALGIGANTAIFSVLNAAILRPLEYPRPDRLLLISSQFATLGFDQFWVSASEFLEFRDWTHAFSSVGAYVTGDSNLAAPDRPQRVRAMTASADLFPTLGVAAQQGRTFDAAETRPGGAPVVVLSYGVWQSAFGGDRSLVGKPIDVDGVRRTVIGIMPRNFDVADQHVAIWLPLVIDPATAARAGHFLYLIGRLADRQTMVTASAELETILGQWRARVSGTNAAATSASGFPHTPTTTDHRLRFDPLQAQVVGNARTAVWVLQGAVVLVLLIACANLSTLLLSRAESRRKEFAVRTALGAPRSRLVRQSIVEGCVLSIAGGALGVGFAVAGIQALLAAYPDALPRTAALSVDWTALVFTSALAILTGIVFGVAPVLHIAPELTAAALKEGGTRTTSRRHLVRYALVVSEVALAVALVASAGLLLRTLGNLTRVDGGFNRSQLVTFAVSLPNARYATPVERRSFYARLMDQLRATPGVLQVAGMTGLPPVRKIDANTTDIEGFVPRPNGPSNTIDYYNEISTDYLATMGIPVLEGRAFQDSDAAEAPVVIVNQTMARALWPGESALGHRLRPGRQLPWSTIVGVVRDVKQGGVDKKTGTELFFPAGRRAPGTMSLVVRTPLGAQALAGTIQRILATLDPSLPIIGLRAMDDVFEQAIGRPRLLAQLLTIFAALALLLSTIGTYGVLSYMVAERRREIGIRLALGATPSSVLRMVVGQGLGLTLVGVGAGLVLTVAASRALTSLLFGVGSTDPVTIAAVVALIGSVALVACYLPGRSATRVDPMVALRNE